MTKISTRYLLLFIVFSFFSCEEILMVEDISKKEIILVAPANDAALSFSGITFSWEIIQGAEKYHLQIASPNFDAPQQIVLDTIISKNSFVRQLNIGNYQWRVKALNSAYESQYSTRSFGILNNDDFQNNTVVLVSPQNNLATKTASQKLSWNIVIGAEDYQLQILDPNNNLIKELLSQSATVNYTFEEGGYIWRVRARNKTAQTLFSSRSILIDTKVPNTPSLSAPANTSTATGNNISFQWSRSPIVGSQEKDSLYVYTENALTNLSFKEKASSPYERTLSKGTYYWFVKSFDEAGNESKKSTVFTFTVN